MTFLLAEREVPDVAALVAQSLHQADRIGTELLEMPVLLVTAGNAWNFFESAGHDSSGYFSC